MRLNPTMLAFALFGLLIAVFGLSSGPGEAEIGGGHAHMHAHQHGGSVHHHVHTHPEPIEDERSEASWPTDDLGCSTDPSDHGHCCHDHDHDHGSCEDALLGRNRNSVQTTAALTHQGDWALLSAAPRMHRQLWPYARGRPPDHLAHLRTVVLLN